MKLIETLEDERFREIWNGDPIWRASLRASLEKVARLEKAKEGPLLSLLNYIEATPETGFLPGDMQVIIFRAKEVRTAIAEVGK